MDLTNRTVIKDLFRKYGVRPEKYLGQHFILSKKALAQMVAAAEIKKNDTIIEIGSGLGTLTQELAKTLPGRQAGGAKIIAIEKDPKMINILGETLADYKNIKIIQADARKFPELISEIKNFSDFGNLKSQYKIVANLPYNIATFLIRQWLDPPVGGPPELMVLMIQKEVAQRICAKPPRSNLLSISVQFYADAKILGYVPKEMFWPKPKVDSAIIEIIPKKRPPQKMRNAFFVVVRAGFSQPRKQLIGNLIKKLPTKDGKITKEKLLEIFKKISIPERARAENLSLEQWILLANNLRSTTQRERN